jgi:hypothetical protein
MLSSGLKLLQDGISALQQDNDTNKALVLLSSGYQQLSALYTALQQYHQLLLIFFTTTFCTLQELFSFTKMMLA